MRKNETNQADRYMRHRLVHIAGCIECRRLNNELFFACARNVRVPRSLRIKAKAVHDDPFWVESV